MDLETSPQECWQIYHQLHSLKKYEKEGSFLCEKPGGVCVCAAFSGELMPLL
jgi:hypothetical protein